MPVLANGIAQAGVRPTRGQLVRATCQNVSVSPRVGTPQGSVKVVPPIFPLFLYLSDSSGLRLGEACRPERKIKKEKQEKDYWARDRL